MPSPRGESLSHKKLTLLLLQIWARSNSKPPTDSRCQNWTHLCAYFWYWGGRVVDPHLRCWEMAKIKRKWACTARFNPVLRITFNRARWESRSKGNCEWLLNEGPPLSSIRVKITAPPSEWETLVQLMVNFLQNTAPNLMLIALHPPTHCLLLV